MVIVASEQYNQIAIWKNARIAQPDIPDPLENDGSTKKTGVLEPLRFKEGDVVHESMVIDAVSNEDSEVEDVNFPAQDHDYFSDQFESEISESEADQ